MGEVGGVSSTHSSSLHLLFLLLLLYASPTFIKLERFIFGSGGGIRPNAILSLFSWFLSLRVWRRSLFLSFWVR